MFSKMRRYFGIDKVRGYIPEQPELPLEQHSGLNTWRKLYHSHHEGYTLTEKTTRTAIPFRPIIRGGVRTATPEYVPTPNFVFLIGQLNLTPKQGVNTRVLFAQQQSPIGQRFFFPDELGGTQIASDVHA